jgi:four helix bundle protein
MASIPRRHGPERLRVHDLALQFEERLEELLSRARCSASLKEQLLRAAESAILNIAEGSGHTSRGRKVYHYQVAHGSIAECIAGLLIIRRRNPRLDIQPVRRIADMICVMLRSLVRRFQDGDGG